MKGSEYFRVWAQRLGINDYSKQPEGLKVGAVESKLGGRITRDLTRLSPEETAKRRRESEEFLKQPVQHVRAEGCDPV